MDARESGAEIWLVVPRGHALPAPLFEGLVRASFAEYGDDAPFEEWSEPEIDAVVGPDGRDPFAALSRRADCGVAPELLRLG